MTFCTYDGLGCGVLARAAILGNIRPQHYNLQAHSTYHRDSLSSSCLLWPPCVADADIIFFALWFLLLLSSILWPPYVIRQAIFSSRRLFFFFFFFPRLISAVADWISTILPHTVWPTCEFEMQVWNVLQNYFFVRSYNTLQHEASEASNFVKVSAEVRISVRVSFEACWGGTNHACDSF